MSKREAGVDFLRGVSILAVVGYHYYFALPVSDFGLYGVFLFLVISGYCMSPSVESSSTATTFLTKRIFRIVPALIVCALITAIIEYLAPISPERGQSWVQVAQSIVCIPSIDLPCILVGRPGYNMVDGAYWSLRVEVKFYVLLALCYFGISKRYYLQTLFCAMAIGAAALYYFPHTLTKNTLQRSLSRLNLAPLLQAW